MRFNGMFRSFCVPIFFCLAAAFPVRAQVSKVQSQSVAEAETLIAALEQRVGQAPTDSERIAASDSIAKVLTAVFDSDDAFTYAFPAWKKMGSLTSSDGAFRLFNWNVPLHDGTYRYRALILFPDKTHRDLTGSTSPDRSSEGKIIPAGQWYGALYYQIEPVTHKRETYYTLMGWEGHNSLSSKKILDVLWFNERGEPLFGKPVFRDGDEVKMRRVFEFTKGAQMTLAYLPAKEAIVYDDLIPMPGSGEGNYSAYVPGTIHRGYRLHKGEWIYQERIDMARPKSEAGKSQFNFPERPDLNRKRKPGNPLIGE